VLQVLQTPGTRGPRTAAFSLVPKPESGRMFHSPQVAGWILEQAADAVVYASADGRIDGWNHAASLMFGYEPGEAMGQSLDLIIPEHLRDAHWKGFRRAMELGEARLAGRPVVTRARHKDGRKLYVEMTFSLVRGDASQVLGSVAIARDVTGRVERERAEAREQAR
jgi:PAS domain S-box-containing protein